MGLLPFEEIQYEVIEKRSADTDPACGKRPEERSVEELLDFGFVNLDKPDGPTSFKASDELRKAIGAEKSGHTGTLDPIVTGVLPVALGRATRLTTLFLPAGKEYQGTMRIHGEVEEGALKQVLDEFVGRIRQLPPVRSRVKRVERDREVYYLEISSIKGGASRS